MKFHITLLREMTLLSSEVGLPQNVFIKRNHTIVSYRVSFILLNEITLISYFILMNCCKSKNKITLLYYYIIWSDV